MNKTENSIGRFEIVFTDYTIWYLWLSQEQYDSLSVAPHVRMITEVSK